MNPIKFLQANTLLVGPEGENDPNVKPLPAHFANGVFTTCWELSDEDIEEILKTKRLYLMVLSGQQGPPPVNMQVTDPFIKHKYGYCILPFEHLDENGEGNGQFIHIWNSQDAEILEQITIDGKKLKLNTTIPGYVPTPVTEFTPDHFKTTKYLFRKATENEVNEKVAQLLELPHEQWPKLYDKTGAEIPPPRNAEDFLKGLLKDVPVLDKIGFKEPAPKFEKGGTGFDGDSENNQEAVVKNMPNNPK